MTTRSSLASRPSDRKALAVDHARAFTGRTGRTGIAERDSALSTSRVETESRPCRTAPRDDRGIERNVGGGSLRVERAGQALRARRIAPISQPSNP